MGKWLAIGVVVAVAVGAVVVGLLYQNHLRAAHDPAFFESSIVEFEEADEAVAPAPGGIVFVGSSSIRFWTALADQMAPLAVTRRGFGGAHMSHVLHNVHRIVTPQKPVAVVVYAGDNDLASGKTAEIVLSEYQALAEAVWGRVPEARIYFIAIKPSLLRWEIWPEMKRTNRLVSTWSAQDSRLGYLDVASPMLGADTTPRPELFILEGLHLSDEGYRVWANVIRSRLLADGVPDR